MSKLEVIESEHAVNEMAPRRQGSVRNGDNATNVTYARDGPFLRHGCVS